MSGTSSTVNTLTTYLDLITSEHAGKPDYVAFVTALLQPLVDSQSFYSQLLTTFDLDTAIGVQLDAVGLWIGRSREVITPLAGVYFSWDTAGLGWDAGSWQGQFDPNSGLTSLDDDTYRALLKAKVIMNYWDGSIPVAASALSELFFNTPGTIISIQDNQDMTMTVSISGQIPAAVVISLLQGGYLPIVPEGVGVNYVITSVNTTALFGWDTENATVAGWDKGAWGGLQGVLPGVVTGVALVSTTASAVTLAWLAPVLGSGPYSYQVQYQLGTGISGVWILAGTSVTSTQETISGLSPNTTYTFEVYAINDSGSGPASAPFTVTSDAGPPVQVTGVLVSGSTATTVNLVWNALSGNGITYQVQYAPVGVSTFTNYGTPIAVNSEVISGLVSSQNYNFRVYAINQFGSGQVSAPVTGGTSGVLPGAIQNLTITSIGINDIALSWGQPLTNNGPYTYTVQFAKNVNPVSYSVFTGQITNTANGGTCDVTGLVASQSYLFSVTASNTGGNGPASTSVSGTTNTAIPSAPTNLVASAITATTCALTWSTATDASTYQVQRAFLAAPNVFTNVGSPTTSTTETVIGLVAGTSYVFQVYAINSSNVSGPPSTTISVVTEGAAPGQVLDLTDVITSNTSIVLTWAAPLTGTGTPVYQVQYQLFGAAAWTNFGATTTALTESVTGLQAGSIYNFQIVASNDFGTGIPSASITVSTTGTVSVVTWNPSDHSTNVQLSDSNLEASSIAPPVTNLTSSNATLTALTLTWTAANPAGFFGVRGTESVSTGKVYIEFTLTANTTDFAVGIATAAWNFNATKLGGDANGLGVYPNA